MDASFHESDDRLELYALSRLGDSDVEQIEEHLILCEACRHRLEQVGDPALSLREELRARPLEPSLGSWFAWFTPRLGMAGVFAAMVLAVGIYWMGTGARFAPVASLQLAAMRGDMPSIPSAARTDLTLTDAPETGGPFRLELVDGSGAKVWNGIPDNTARALKASVDTRLSPGDYFMRLYSAKGDLVHEYGFRILK